MPGDITRLDLRQRRRSTLAYIVFDGFAVLVVALYPTFRHDQALDELTQGNEKLSALFGATGSLTSPEGWMNANLYANLVPLFALLMTIGFGAATVAGQDEEGSLGTWVSQPVTRGRVLAEKLVALGAPRPPGPPRHPGRHSPRTTVPARPRAVGAARHRRGSGPTGPRPRPFRRRRDAGPAAAFAYVVSSLAPVVDWIHGLRWTSLFWWSVGSDQLSAGLHVTNLAVLLCGGAALVVAASAGFTRLDIH